MGQLQDFLDRLVDSVGGAFSLEVPPGLDEREAVEKVVSETALVAGLVGCLQPLPALDLLLLAPLHGKMVLQIGRVKGHEVSPERAADMVKEIAAAAGVTLAAQGVISAIGKISPFTRALLSFPITYAATFALGRVAEYYFDCLNEGSAPSSEAMKDLFAAEFQVGKRRGAAFDREEMRRRAEELRERLARRDPTLVTRTRLDPKPPAAAGVSEPARARGPREKIKITLRPRGADAAREGAEPSEEDPPPRAVKTIGPDAGRPDPPEISFAPAPKTVGGGEEELPSALAGAPQRSAGEAEGPGGAG
ncbi:MAG: DUF697 domain-containing protein, partial [Planctomycetota bacterium]